MSKCEICGTEIKRKYHLFNKDTLDLKFVCKNCYDKHKVINQGI